MTDNLTWQVVSLELAEELRDLGVPQESLFYWWKANAGNRGESWEISRYTPTKDTADGECYSAFTVAELGRMLPSGRYELVSDHIKRWALWSWEQGFSASTEAGARAKMLIYLIKNNLIDVKALNTK